MKETDINKERCDNESLKYADMNTKKLNMNIYR